MDITNKNLERFYFQITDLWKNLCEEHNKLFDLTCDEYSLLLGSEIDSLEIKIKKKQEVIQQIEKLENKRSKLITKLKEFCQSQGDSPPKIESISDVLNFFEVFEKRSEARHLFRFNKFLIDIIDKIQTQNKKNQLFINKTLKNLKDIREQAMGVKTYSTYNHKGGSNASSFDSR